MAGSGYRVQVENLQDFAKKVRGLLAEFDAGANGEKTHAGSGVAASSFGPFAEARQLDERYGVMRDTLRDVLDVLYRSMDDAQRNADATARNYAEQEHGAAASMHPGSSASSGTAPARTAAEQGDTW